MSVTTTFGPHFNIFHIGIIVFIMSLILVFIRFTMEDDK